MSKPPPVYTGKQPYIFVGYAREDSDMIHPLLEWLHIQGFNLWYDEGVKPGRSRPDDLAGSINAASVFLFFISPHSVQSNRCVSEVSYAADQGIPLLPVAIEKTTVPPGLNLSIGSYQVLERTGHSEREFRRSLRRSLQDLLEQRLRPVTMRKRLAGEKRDRERSQPRAELSIRISAVGARTGRSRPDHPHVCRASRLLHSPRGRGLRRAPGHQHGLSRSRCWSVTRAVLSTLPAGKIVTLPVEKQESTHGFYRACGFNAHDKVGYVDHGLIGVRRH